MRKRKLFADDEQCVLAKHYTMLRVRESAAQRIFTGRCEAITMAATMALSLHDQSDRKGTDEPEGGDDV